MSSTENNIADPSDQSVTSEFPRPSTSDTPENADAVSINPTIQQSIHPSVSGRRRRNGKIAALPNSVREQINRMLQDGVAYQAIIERLSLPPEITKHHLSEWKDGGYEDWLKDQFWQEEMRDRHQVFSGLKPGSDAIQLPEGGLQLAAIELCELLRDISELSADEKPDPDRCVRLANALARVSRSILQLQQYRDACARARAALQQLKDPNRKLSENETRAVVRHVDSILGLQSIDGTNGESEDPTESASDELANNDQITKAE